MVREAGLEPALFYQAEPKSAASTNFAILALSKQKIVAASVILRMSIIY
jgi:hypothetical protein